MTPEKQNTINAEQMRELLIMSGSAAVNYDIERAIKELVYTKRTGRVFQPSCYDAVHF